MSRIKEDVVIGSVILAIGLAALAASFQIEPDYSGQTGARAFPIMSAGALLLLGALQLFSASRTDARPAPEKKKGGLRGPFLLLGLVGAYLWLIGKLGYLIATGLVVPVALAMFGVRNPVGLVIAAVVVPAIYHLIFFELLGVFPPYGQWFDLLDVIKG
ncbi:tripartite tricarboxylate transporter TctB family protein [Roseovarius sp. 2305UL8-3]|uniref:tripartite tricarboxylate transporter TctB family protein n=1 Tax=Roseovarius conchicola TaxID=3121636 RepID=UPI00352882EE